MKKMIFKFAGGPLDGKIVVGESGKEKEAQRYNAITTTGALGNDFTQRPTTPLTCSPRNNSKRRSRITFSSIPTRWWIDSTTVTC